MLKKIHFILSIVLFIYIDLSSMERDDSLDELRQTNVQDQGSGDERVLEPAEALRMLPSLKALLIAYLVNFPNIKDLKAEKQLPKEIQDCVREARVLFRQPLEIGSYFEKNTDMIQNSLFIAVILQIARRRGLLKTVIEELVRRIVIDGDKQTLARVIDGGVSGTLIGKMVISTIKDERLFPVLKYLVEHGADSDELANFAKLIRPFANSGPYVAHHCVTTQDYYETDRSGNEVRRQVRSYVDIWRKRNMGWGVLLQKINTFLCRVTELMNAALNGRLEEVKALLEASTFIDARDRGGNTVTMIAAQGGYREIVDLLLSYGADVTAVNWNGENAADRAESAGHDELARYMHLQCDTTRNNPEQHEVKRALENEFLVAASVGNKEAVERLLSEGVSIEARDSNGNTAIMLAARCGYRETIDLLLQHGAAVRAENWVGENASTLATQTGQRGIARFLRSYRGAAGEQIEGEDRLDILARRVLPRQPRFDQLTTMHERRDPSQLEGPIRGYLTTQVEANEYPFNHANNQRVLSDEESGTLHAMVRLIVNAFLRPQLDNLD